MQLTLAFLTAMASAAKAATLNVESDMILTNHQTFYGFNVAATAEPDESSQHDGFINACLTSSYNSINDPTKYSVKKVIPEAETIVVAPPSADNNISNLDALPLNYYRFYIFANIVTATCRGCNPDNDPRSRLVQEYDLFGEWESAFCTCLQRSTDAVLKTATECAIERPAITQTKQRVADHDEVTKSLEATNDMILTNHQTFYGFNVAATAEPDESSQHDGFINACLTSSYNSINDPTKYSVKKVIPEAETIVVAPPSADDNISNLDALPLNYYRFYIFANIVTATCRGCNPDNDPRSRLVQDYDLFGEWESAFCTCLQRSTDAVLKTATECAIERPAITQTKQRVADHDEVTKSLEATNDMILTNHQTFYGFNVAATAEPDESSQHDGFINACLTSSYNSINDPTKYSVKKVIPEAETIVVAPPSTDNNISNLDALPLNYYRFYIFANIVTATCRGCNPDNDPRSRLVQDYDLFGEWESAFCTCLQGSTDAVLKTATECAIERPAITQTKQRVDEHEEVATFVSKTARALGEVVEQAVNNNLRGSA